MLSQSSQPTRGPRRSSVGAKTRVCVHCGRNFRRTEHLERHIRTRKDLSTHLQQALLFVYWQLYCRHVLLMALLRYEREAVRLFLRGGFYTP
jgi:hypothetical protein